MEPPPSSSPEKSLRLPGTCASHYAGDPHPGRGRMALFALIAVDTFGMLFELYRFLATGHFEALLVLVTREVFMACLYFSFWAGLSWGRWFIATTSFFYGLWLMLWSPFLVDAAGSSHGIFLAIGSVEVSIALYVALSPDITAFLRQQRERRSARTLAPMGMLLGTYIAAVLVAWFALGIWRRAVERKAAAFAFDSIREIGARWDTAALDERSSPELLAMEPLLNRQQRCARIRDSFGNVTQVFVPPELQEVVISGGGAQRFQTKSYFVYSGKAALCRFRLALVFHGDLAGEHWEIDSYYITAD